jgi:hypothetical protein
VRGGVGDLQTANEFNGAIRSARWLGSIWLFGFYPVFPKWMPVSSLLFALYFLFNNWSTEMERGFASERVGWRQLAA